MHTRTTATQLLPQPTTTNKNRVAAARRAAASAGRRAQHDARSHPHTREDEPEVLLGETAQPLSPNPSVITSETASMASGA